MVSIQSLKKIFLIIMDETGGHYANCNNPVTGRLILGDSTYIRYII